jgi:RNA polymerase sigma-70 factor (ECF subfamily)
MNTDPDQSIRLSVEGWLVGPWIEELRQQVEKALPEGKVTLDLENLLFVDSYGAALLRELAARHVAHVNCSTFISQQLKETDPMTNGNATATALTKGNIPPVGTESIDPKAAREHELMQRVLRGEKDLFYDLIRPYERGVFLAAASILGNDADAEEVAQEAFLKAFKHLADFRQESKFSTWLIRIAINEAKMKLRKDHRHLYESLDDGQRTDDGDQVPSDVADWREIPSEALEQSELRVALENVLKSLPEKYRTVLILRDVQQMSVAETAHALRISEENVKTRTSRARLQMRSLLTPRWEGGSLAGKPHASQKRI